MMQPEDIAYPCIGCGTRNPVGAEVCRGCGHRIHEPDPDPHVPPGTRISDPRSRPRDLLSRVVATIVLVGATLVASLIACVFTCSAVSFGGGNLILGLELGGLSAVIAAVGIGFLIHYVFRSPKSDRREDR